MDKKKLSIILFIFLFHAFNTLAEETKKIADIEGKGDQPDPACCHVLIKGYVDVSYNHLSRENVFVSEEFNRAFDLNENGFTLQQATLSLGWLPPEGFGALIQTVLGSDALRIVPNGYTGDIGLRTVGFVPLQLYVQYIKGPLSIVVGEFNSLAGLESVEPPENTVFSLSLLSTFSPPGSHLGVRAIYKFSEQFELTMGLNNGWDNLQDTGRGKTTEIGFIYNPNDKTSLVAQCYFGEERISAEDHFSLMGMRFLLDTYGSYQLTNRITLLFNYDYGSQDSYSYLESPEYTAIWWGLTGYLNYQLTEKWLISLRAEEFNDRDGFRTGIPQRLKGGTITFNYYPHENVIIRAETRVDVSNKDTYLNIDTAGTGNKQFSYGLEFLVTFSNGKKG